jgi:hypothetical protein
LSEPLRLHGNGSLCRTKFTEFDIFPVDRLPRTAIRDSHFPLNMRPQTHMNCDGNSNAATMRELLEAQ